MRIHVIQDDAFVEIGEGYLLCIGKLAEVKGATPEKISHMIQEAFAWAQYRLLPETPTTVH